MFIVIFCQLHVLIVHVCLTNLSASTILNLRSFSAQMKHKAAVAVNYKSNDGEAICNTSFDQKKEVYAWVASGQRPCVHVL